MMIGLLLKPVLTFRVDAPNATLSGTSQNLRLIELLHMKYFKWESQKNEKLKQERNISFEQVVFHIEQGNLLDVLEHPNQQKYPGQRIFVVQIEGYAYVVPFVEDERWIFLKTIFPSRKLTKKYLSKEEQNV